MKNFLIKSAVILLCSVCLVISAAAQQKKRQKVRKKVVKPTAAATISNNDSEIKATAEKVSTQIKNVSKFLFNLGGVARVIEDLDRDIAARKASRSASALNTKNKQAIITTFKNLRAGLVALEIEFRTKSSLKNYLFQIQGISGMAELAEEQASDGQLTESGRTLLMVVEKLSDTLVSLP